MYHARAHLHALLVKYFSNKELDSLYLSVFLKSLADSLISIFVPIYLLTLGYGIAEIASYYFAYGIALLVSTPLFLMLNSRIGVKKTMALGTMAWALYYYMLDHVAQGMPYLVAAVAFGLSVSCYYSAFHLEFTKCALRKRQGSELSVLKVIAIMSQIAGPLLGSLFISGVSFSSLFLVVAVLMFASTIPLLMNNDFSIPQGSLSIRRALKADSARKAVGYWAQEAIVLSSEVFWPLFIFIALGSIVSLGTIISISSVALILGIFYIGDLADRNTVGCLRKGAVLHAFTWIARIFLISPIGIVFSNIASALTLSAVDISFSKMMYEDARRKRDKLSYFLFRQLHLMIGRGIVLVAAMLTGSLEVVFILCFLLSLGYLITARRQDAVKV